MTADADYALAARAAQQLDAESKARLITYLLADDGLDPSDLAPILRAAHSDRGDFALILTEADILDHGTAVAGEALSAPLEAAYLSAFSTDGLEGCLRGIADEWLREQAHEALAAARE